MSTTTTLDHPLASGFAPAWAAEWGEDRFGVFAVLRVGETEQKLRYLPPDSFRMGSPGEEEGRFDTERPPHVVSLAEGFWLADTPCTQELWREVTGLRPSRFPSPRRPVERVSWDDIQEFLRQLEKRVPGCGAGLPTEEQWEYACRAGTTTSTYAGDLRILGSNNAPVLDGIAWYGGNSGVGFELEEGQESADWPEKQHPHTRAGTHPVGSKLPNAWGLFDMLGNVWEWCADARPPRQSHGRGFSLFMASFRHSRGGSWLNSAKRARAACQSWDERRSRRDNRGFRFSLGQPRSG